MAEEQKPVVAETLATEPAPAASVETPAAPAAEPTAAATEAKAEAPAETPAEASTTPAAPVEEKKEKKEKKPVEPITSGALGYKAPGLVKSLIFSKKYFWFGDEPVSTQKLSHYLRGEKPEVAHPTAAWSSQTGKGLLYFVKHADQKETPAGVLNLAEPSDAQKDGTSEFSFKLNGHKHTFQATSAPERDGWFIAIEAAIKEAKEAREGIIGSEGYKEEIKKLGKPATLAAAGATATKAEGSTPKKSTEVKPADAAARAGSSSSSSDDAEGKKKKKKSKSKSRSVSRGKRVSIFGSLLGKKEEHEEKKEEKAEEKAEKKEEGEAAAATPAVPLDAEGTAARVAAAPVVPAEETKPAETTPAAATEPAAETSEAPKTTPAAPKPTKRGSIFGNFVEKLRSPTFEKKESEVAPSVQAKEPEAASPVPAPPETTETPAAPVAPAAPTETTSAPAPTATTPHKEKKHFFDSFLGKEKAKSPTIETAPKAEAPKVEAPKTEETPAVAPEITEAPAAEAPKTETPANGVTTTATSTVTPEHKDKRRTSFFGNFGGSVKKDKSAEGETIEKHSSKLSGLFRNPSKAVKGRKEKEAAAPAKAEETAEPAKEEAAPAKTEPEAPAATETTPAATEPNAIGDVVPDAVTVGQAPKSAPQVHATA